MAQVISSELFHPEILQDYEGDNLVYNQTIIHGDKSAHTFSILYQQQLMFVINEIVYSDSEIHNQKAKDCWRANYNLLQMASF